MLLSVLRLTPKKWIEILKGCGRRMPRDLHEYEVVKRMLLRENVLHGQAFGFTRQAGNPPHKFRGSFLTGDQQALPPFACLDQFAAGGLNSSYALVSRHSPCPPGEESEAEDEILVYDDCFVDSSSGPDTDESQWDEEDRPNHWPTTGREDLQRKRVEDKAPRGEIYWAQRSAQRCYRVATGRFGPRRRFKGRHLAKKLKTKRFAIGKRPRRGFFVAERFVSVDHILENEMEGYVQAKAKRKRRSAAPRDQRCFKCGDFGHWATTCPYPQNVCHICKRFGHVNADCPKDGQRMQHSTASIQIGHSLWLQRVGVYILNDMQHWDQQRSQRSLPTRHTEHLWQISGVPGCCVIGGNPAIQHDRGYTVYATTSS